MSKSTHSTPTSSRLSSTIEARNWSVESSMPRKRAGPVFGAGMGSVSGFWERKEVLSEIAFPQSCQRKRCLLVSHSLRYFFNKSPPADVIMPISARAPAVLFDVL